MNPRIQRNSNHYVKHTRINFFNNYWHLKCFGSGDRPPSKEIQIPQILSGHQCLNNSHPNPKWTENVRVEMPLLAAVKIDILKGGEKIKLYCY